MASQQIDPKWTYIHHEMLEALYKTNLNSVRFRIMLFVFRQTNGYHEKSVTISNQALADEIGSKRAHVATERTWLVEHNYLVKVKGETDRAVAELAVQPDVSIWGSLRSQTTDSPQDQQVTVSQEQRIISSSSSQTISSQKQTSLQSQPLDSSLSQTSPTPPYKEERNVKENPSPAGEIGERLAALGLWPNQIKYDLAKRPSFSIADVAACEAWVKANAHLPKPDLTLHSEFLQHGNIPKVPTIQRNVKANGSRAAPPGVTPQGSDLTMDDIKRESAKRRAALEERRNGKVQVESRQ